MRTLKSNHQVPKYFLTLLLFLSLQLVLKAQQTIDDFKNKYIKVPHETELKSIYFLDVFEYYNLYGYSDLKKEVFKESEEYRLKLNSLMEMKSSLFKTNYYYDQDYNSDIDIKDRTSKYNMQMKNFTFTSRRLTSWFFDKAYLQIDKFCFKTLPGVSVSTLRNANFEGMLGKQDITTQTQSYSQLNINQALKVEENIRNVHFLYLFNINAVKEFSYDSFFSNEVSKGLYFLASPQKIIVYNSQTKEIYKIYSVN